MRIAFVLRTRTTATTSWRYGQHTFDFLLSTSSRNSHVSKCVPAYVCVYIFVTFATVTAAEVYSARTRFYVWLLPCDRMPVCVFVNVSRRKHFFLPLRFFVPSELNLFHCSFLSSRAPANNSMRYALFVIRSPAPSVYITSFVIKKN